MENRVMMCLNHTHLSSPLTGSLISKCLALVCHQAALLAA